MGAVAHPAEQLPTDRARAARGTAEVRGTLETLNRSQRHVAPTSHDRGVRERRRRRRRRRAFSGIKRKNRRWKQRTGGVTSRGEQLGSRGEEVGPSNAQARRGRTCRAALGPAQTTSSDGPTFWRRSGCCETPPDIDGLSCSRTVPFEVWAGKCWTCWRAGWQAGRTRRLTGGAAVLASLRGTGAWQWSGGVPGAPRCVGDVEVLADRRAAV